MPAQPLTLTKAGAEVTGRDGRWTVKQVGLGAEALECGQPCSVWPRRCRILCGDGDGPAPLLQSDDSRTNGC